jgi:histidinol phosphatase-like enzyme
MKKYLFVDRDGTLIVEPPDQQIDSYAKLALCLVWSVRCGAASTRVMSSSW